MGRHKTVFSDEQIEEMENMALQGCQTGTIATYMGIDRQLLDLHTDILRKLTKKRAERKLSLRTAQTEKAVQGKDTAMLCFLGKNELGQADKQEHTHGVTDGLAELMKEISASGAGLPIKG